MAHFIPLRLRCVAVWYETCVQGESVVVKIKGGNDICGLAGRVTCNMGLTQLCDSQLWITCKLHQGRPLAAWYTEVCNMCSLNSDILENMLLIWTNHVLVKMQKHQGGGFKFFIISTKVYYNGNNLKAISNTDAPSFMVGYILMEPSSAMTIINQEGI